MLDLLTSPAFVATAVPSAMLALGTAAAMEWRMRRALRRAGLGPERPAANPGPQVERFASPGVRAGPSAGAPESEPRVLPESAKASGPAAATAAAAPPLKAVQPRIYMGDRQQMTEFLRWLIGEDYCGKYPHHEWVKFYHDWAAARSIAPIPEQRFLTLLGKVESVRHSRERTKDRDGRVLRNAAGTPLRVSFYDLPRPERVPAADHPVPRMRRAA